MFEFNNKRLNLQLFGGEGGTGGAAPAGDGGEGSATTVGTAADDGQQALRALGVPEELLQKRAKSLSAKRRSVPEIATQTQAVAVQETVQQDAAANYQPTMEEPAQAKLTFAERMEKEPELKEEVNKYARDLVQKRLKEEKSAKERLEALTPLMQYLADSTGLDFEGLDVEQLTNLVKDDFLTKESLRMGTSRETAEELIEKRHGDKRAELQRKAEEQLAVEQSREQGMRKHFDTLMEQGNALKQSFPNFDLMTEIQNPLFMALTEPRMLSLGMTVEKAYRQIHQQEINAMQNQQTAQKITQQVTNAIRSGQNRPMENGVSGRAPSVTTFDYKNANKQQREAFKKQIYEAAARGEKIYPGQYSAK